MATPGNTVFDTLILTYRRALLGLFAMLPLLAILYLQYYQDPTRVFEHHLFHVIAIILAIVLGLFAAYVAWRCYLASGDVFLRWITLGFLGFALVYAPHGFFTPLADTNPWLFLLYGPVSRLVMAVCFLIAIWYYLAPPDTHMQRHQLNYWWRAAMVFVAIDVLVAVWAYSSWNASTTLRVALEYSAITIYAAIILLMVLRRIYNSLMIIFALSLAWFALSSLSFTYGLAWNHQWWLAHLIFASGFLLLSFGVVQAWLSTRSFARVYSQAELMEQLRKEKNRAEQAMTDLQLANRQLERLAATDSLTGAANRRELMSRAEEEAALAERHRTPVSLILIDLDHFKKINDQHGHPAGDSVLKYFADQVSQLLRPGDLLGRVGGEEFAILLPKTGVAEARLVAERLRKTVAGQPARIEDETIAFSLSAGIAAYDPQVGGVQAWFSKADQLLYKAKSGGRNRVEPA